MPPTPSKFLHYFPKVFYPQGPGLKEGQGKGGRFLNQGPPLSAVLSGNLFHFNTLKSSFGLAGGEREAAPHRPTSPRIFPGKPLTSETIQST